MRKVKNLLSALWEEDTLAFRYVSHQLEYLYEQIPETFNFLETEKF